MDINIIQTGSQGNCIIVNDGIGYIMLDCGLTAKTVRGHGQYIFSSFDAILITHEHEDHSKGFKGFSKLGCTFVMSNGTKTAICGDILARINIIKHMQWVETENFKIMAFDVKHDAAEPLGYLVVSKNTGEKVLFITDTAHIPVRMVDIDYYLLECNYSIDILLNNYNNGRLPKKVYNRIIKSHIELGTLKKYLAKCDLSKTKAIFLIHLSDSNSNEDYFISEIEKATGNEVYCG